jgi:hypothetical protein
MKSIEYYTDYRTFLSDFYREKKNASPLFSYRTFCRMAELKSPSIFKEVVSGKRGLTSPVFLKIWFYSIRRKARKQRKNISRFCADFATENRRNKSRFIFSNITKIGIIPLSVSLPLQCNGTMIIRYWPKLLCRLLKHPKRAKVFRFCCVSDL